MDDVYYEGSRAYCGHCGGELDMDSGEVDVVDAMVGRRAPRPMSHDDDDDLDELDEELDEDLDEEALDAEEDE